ncbi:MAG: TetR/AcrR family transcriptional regulator [Roseibium sp.]
MTNDKKPIASGNAKRKAADKSKQPVKRDAERSKKSILDAALMEFSTCGYSGARIDNIAKLAGVSKPLLYDYYGDKDAIYAAALREAYVQIREGEKDLDLENLGPEQAIRTLVKFTLQHFQSKPWFISMLNTENLRGGTTIRAIKDANDIQSQLLEKLGEILRQGVDQGVFRAGIDPVELYISIASLCYFPVSNAHTLRAVFKCDVDAPWLEKHGDNAAEMLIRFLKPS